MLLWLTPAQTDEMFAHIERELPREACGLIGGTIQNGVYRAQMIVPIPNRAEQPLHHFRMDDAALVQTLLDFEARGLSLIGIYHSHPSGGVIPSQEDIRAAMYPRTPYLIVGKRGNDTELGVWDIRHGQVTPVALHLSDQPPLASNVPASSSPAVTSAILISTLVAVVLMLVLSLSLLPPAPEIIR